MQMPKISVIVPSYNQAMYLEKMLRSVIDQKYPNLELIVIDGGSTDESQKIIERYASSIAYWVSEADKGQTDALIKGFSRSTGDIQCWLNSDDLHEPHTLREVADYFQCHPGVGAVYGDTIWIDTDDRPMRVHREIPFSRFIWLHTYNYVMGMSMFWRRSLYEAVGGLDRKFNLAMDADLWIRFSRVGRIAHVRCIWSRMRFYPDQKTRRLRDAGGREDWAIRIREWGVERPHFYRMKRYCAFTARALWRLFTGCYTLGYRRQMEKAEKSIALPATSSTSDDGTNRVIE